MNKFPFGISFQKTIIALMMRNSPFASKSLKYLKPDYFESEHLVWFFEKIKERFEDTGSIPGQVYFEEEARKLPSKEGRLRTKLLKILMGMDVQDNSYIKDQLIDFVRRNIYVDAHEKAADLYNRGQTCEAYDLTLEAIEKIHEVSFEEDNIIKLVDFDKKSIEYYLKASKGEEKFPTNIKELDKILGGGLGRSELGIIQAAPKIGKSIYLIHCGVSCIRSFAGKVAHFVLEGTVEQTMFRYQSRLCEWDYHQIKNNDMPAMIAKRLSKEYSRLGDRLRIVGMGDKFEYSVIDILTEIKEMRMRGFNPDLIIIDYADLLQPRKSFNKIAADDYKAMKWVYRDLKTLAMTQNVAVWSASQSRRPDKKQKGRETKTGADIADSFEKVRVVDFLGSLNQTEAEEKAGIIRLYADIYRDNKCSRVIPVLTDFSRMIFYSMKHQKHYNKINEEMLKKEEEAAKKDKKK